MQETKPRGQSIHLFLVDGTPGGMWVAQIWGRTLRAIVVSRAKLEQLANRPEAQKTGVYILAGIDPENPLRQKIYIGQSENVWGRLREHERNEAKDFWERTVIFSSTDDNLTKSHIVYLESKLIALARSSGRASIENSNATGLPSLPEADKAYLAEWLEWIELLLPVLGYSFANSVSGSTEKNDKIASDENVTLKLRMDKVGVNAHLHQINGEWIIIEGSTVRKEATGSLPDSLSKLRDSLIADKILIEDGNDKNFWKFTKNYPATSLSMAATLIAGTPYSGTGAWIVEETGEAYSLWRERQLNEAEQYQTLDQE